MTAHMQWSGRQKWQFMSFCGTHLTQWSKVHIYHAASWRELRTGEDYGAINGGPVVTERRTVVIWTSSCLYRQSMQNYLLAAVTSDLIQPLQWTRWVCGGGLHECHMCTQCVMSNLHCTSTPYSGGAHPPTTQVQTVARREWHACVLSVYRICVTGSP